VKRPLKLGKNVAFDVVASRNKRIAVTEGMLKPRILR
jgi:hypothetical protein